LYCEDAAAHPSKPEISEAPQVLGALPVLIPCARSCGSALEAGLRGRVSLLWMHPQLMEMSLPTSPFSSSSSAERVVEIKALEHAVNLLPSDHCSLGRRFRSVPVL